MSEHANTISKTLQFYKCKLQIERILDFLQQFYFFYFKYFTRCQGIVSTSFCRDIFFLRLEIFNVISLRLELEV